MRIVGGALRGRRLTAPAGRNTRPTADRAREGLFNILAHGSAFAAFSLAGAHVVDGFAGTGALGLEALSRGAAHATFYETDPASRGALRHNIEALDQDDRAEILARSVTMPGPAPRPAQLVLLDPPYGEALADPALTGLAEAGWLAKGTIVVVEQAANQIFETPSEFDRIDLRRYGSASFTFLRFSRAH
jgi:16S rRNA (guanine966-N2)-methyltransferase